MARYLLGPQGDGVAPALRHHALRRARKENEAVRGYATADQVALQVQPDGGGADDVGDSAAGRRKRGGGIGHAAPAGRAGKTPSGLEDTGRPPAHNRPLARARLPLSHSYRQGSLRRGGVH